MTQTPSGSAVITVIIPHLNQPQMLDRCLASVMGGVRPPDEVLVIDNGSDQLPEAICAAYPGTRLLQQPIPGPGPARNLGITEARGDILAFLDADCIADAQWLAQAEQAMADPEATILGGDVRIAYVDADRLSAIEAYESIYAFRQKLYIERDDYAATCNLITRPAVWRDVGPFPGLEVAEDIEWGKAATAKGYRIRYIDPMRVYHPARTDIAQVKRKWDRHLGHFYADHQTKRFGTLKWLARTAAIAVSPLKEIVTCATSDRLSGFGNRLKAWRCLTYTRFYRTRIMLWLAFTGRHEELSGQWNRSATKPSES